MDTRRRQKEHKNKVILNKKQKEKDNYAKQKVRLKPILALAMVLCLIAVIVFPLSISLVNSLNTLLYIDATDTIVFSVDYTGKVKTAAIVFDLQNFQSFVTAGARTCSANADYTESESEIVFPDLKNQKVEEAVAKAVDYLTKKGGINDDDELIISTVCKNNDYAKKIADRAKRGAEQKAQGTVIVMAGNNKKLEKNNNMSPAKLKYLNEALTLETGYTKEQLESFSTGFLRKLCGYSGNTDNKENKGNNNGNGNNNENGGNNGSDKGNSDNNNNDGDNGGDKGNSKNDGSDKANSDNNNNSGDNGNGGN